MLSAFYEVITGRAPNMFRAYLLAVLIQMVVVNMFIEFEAVQVPYLQFFGIATALGGLVLGLGMVLSLGCAGAVFFRAGEGKIDFIIVTIVFAISAWISNQWLVTPIRQILGGDGISLALPRTLGIDRWSVVTIVAIGVLLWFIRGHQHKHIVGWDWARTGIGVGCVGIAAWVASYLTDHPTGLGMVQGSSNLVEFFLKGDSSALSWSLFMVAATPVGAFIASKRFGISDRDKPIRSQRIPQSMIGGTLMGIGATVAAGDNIVHGLAGVPILGLSSFVVMIFIFAGVWVGIRLGWMN